MKLNYKKWPVFKWYEDKDYKKDIFVDGDLSDYLNRSKTSQFKHMGNIEGMLDNAKKRMFITQTFFDAFLKALPKLPDDVDKWAPCETGIIIFGNFFILYGYDNTDPAGTTGMNYIFNPEGHLGGFAAMRGKRAFGHFPTTTYPDALNGAIHIVGLIHHLLYFVEHVDITIKEWKPKTTVRIGFNKVENETKTPVQVIDSSWFTTLVGRKPHDVSGHLRMVWYKEEGRAKKRLVWVNDYRRGGESKYRFAKKLNKK